MLKLFIVWSFTFVNPSFARISPESEPFSTMAPRRALPHASVAIVYNRESGEILCQTPTANRQDLLPPPLQTGNEDYQLNLPLCSVAEIDQVRYAAHFATFDNRTALLPAVGATALYCFSAALSGGLLTLVSTAVNNNALRGSDSFIGDMATGAAGGAVSGTLTIGLKTYLPTLLKLAGIGAVCGALGGLGANAIFYPIKY